MTTGKWRVYNDHMHGLTHKEKFRGEEIVIPAKEFILMDYEDAVLFKGQYFSMRLNAQGVQDPETYKMIRLEAGPEAVASDSSADNKVYVCMMDGKEFTDKAQLDEYVKANFSQFIVKDENLDKAINKAKGK